MKAFHIFTITLESVGSVYKDFSLSIFHQKSSKIAMFSYISEMYENIAILLDFWWKILKKKSLSTLRTDSRVIVNIWNAFIRIHLPSKHLNSSPSAINVANNKQKVCTKARNCLIFHTGYLRPSEILKNPCFRSHFESKKLSLSQLQEPVETFL